MGLKAYIINSCLIIIFLVPKHIFAQIDLKGSKVTYGAENEIIPLVGDTITEYHEGTNTIKKLKFWEDQKIHIVEFNYEGIKFKKSSYSPDNLKFKTVTKYNNKGNVILIASYDNGIVTGKFKKFYENGKVESEGVYNKMKKDGFWNYYDESGNLINKEFYENGRLIKSGSSSN